MAGEYLGLYRTRIHRYLPEISQICHRYDLWAHRLTVTVPTNLIDFGAMGRDRGRFEVCKARGEAHGAY